ncbi:unnamed protein product [Lymnaea stagnalis]|uniref:Protein phosphatase 1 regulatory subunit 12B n=1 Tax=Lymnaea stagnalis TaxID=6523 RepID=A0AAV2I037_LYMST
MAADEKQVSALMRRHEQIKRWEGSDTNLEPISPKRDRVKVKFQDGCVFLAACSSGDKEEVKRLLQRGADINTANVDGLTALHQACIDDNIEMVEFLVEQGADVDVCDNEGWTPLHATASCAFTEIARYLIKHGANVAAVNNDGDLPMDIAENDEMEALLREEMKKQGIDAESARCEEEERMLEDANQWLKDKTIEEVRHPKTGATALHVASAKGYIKVMNILLEAGADVNAEDFDGWTPLHAAAHWGQEEACKLLVDNMCDMSHKNKAGHTAFDLAEKDMLKHLEELKEKQATFRNNHEVDTEIFVSSGHVGKRRSSVTRMSVDQRQNVIQRTSEEERAALASINDEKILNSISQDDTDETETERKNEKNKQVSQHPQLPSSTTINTSTISTWSRTANLIPLPPGAELRRPDMPKIEEVSETERSTPTPAITTPAIVTTAIVTTASVTAITVTVPPSPSISTTPTATQSSDKTATTAVLSSKPTVSISKVERLADPNSDASLQDSAGKPINSVISTGRDLVSRSISVPARLPTEKLQERLAARRPLSSTGSATTVTTSTVTTTTDSDGKVGDRNSYTFGQTYTGHRSSYGTRTGNYVPYYQLRQQREAAANALANSEEKPITSDLGRYRNSNTGVTPTASSISTPSLPNPASTTTTSTFTPAFRRSYEPPKRDEETETQRKARAKHARQTRRSTQGVSLEDIEKAEEVLRSNDPLNPGGTALNLPSSRNSVITKDNGGMGNGLSSIPSSIPTASTSSTTTSISTSVSDNLIKEDPSVISGYRRRTVEEKNDAVNEVPSTRGSYRRAREEKDLISSSSTTPSDITSNYIPRGQRNSAILSSDPSSSSPSSQSLLRTSSLRTNRIRNGETDIMATKAEEDSKKDESTQEKKDKDEKKEPSSIRSRRQRRERRSTGIVYDNEVNFRTYFFYPLLKIFALKITLSFLKYFSFQNLGSSKYSSRFSSNSDVPSSDRSQRPVSYSEFSKSTGSLDLDYKKKYEDEKSENEKLRKELEESKKSLLEAKAELDKVMKQREPPRNSDRDKRTLERKISEMEEELKVSRELMEKLKAENIKLKEENRALTRVVAKLSK